GLVTRWLFGQQAFDASTGKYLGRIHSGLFTPLQKMFDPSSRGKGVINSWLFGEKQFADSGQFVGRVGGLVDLGKRAGASLFGMFDSAKNAALGFSSALTKVGLGLTALGGAAGGPMLA